MKFFKKIILSISFLLFIQCTYSQYDTIFRIPFPRQYAVLDSLQTKLELMDTLKAAKIINILEIASINSNNELSKKYLEYVKLSYKSGMAFRYQEKNETFTGSFSMTQVIREFKQMLSNLNENEFPVICALIHMHIGNLKNYRGIDYKNAFHEYLKAYALFKKIPINEWPTELRQRSQYFIALSYFEFNDFEKSVELGKEIESQFSKKNYVSLFNMQMIGLSYLHLNKFEQAKKYLNWVYNNAVLNTNPNAWRGIALGSIGTVYFQQNKYQEAIDYYLKSIPLTEKEKVDDNTSILASNLSTIYLKQGKLDLAKKYVNLAYAALQRSPFLISKSSSLANNVTVFNALKNYYKQVGNIYLAYKFMDSTNFYQDILNKRNDINLKYAAEITLSQEKSRNEQFILKASIAKERFIKNYMTAIIILLLVLLIFIFNMGRLKIKNRNQKHISEKILLEVQLSNASTRLSDFTKMLIEKNELIYKANQNIFQLQTEIDSISNHGSTDSEILKVQNDNYNYLQKMTINTDEAWQKFSSLFDIVYPGFLFRLKEKKPELTNSEIRFSTLTKMKLSDKEMASILSVSTGAIRQTRYRLNKSENNNDKSSFEEKIHLI